jgi:hypothetical protein
MFSFLFPLISCLARHEGFAVPHVGPTQKWALGLGPGQAHTRTHDSTERHERGVVPDRAGLLASYWASLGLLGPGGSFVNL